MGTTARGEEQIEVVITDVPSARERFHAIMARLPEARKVSTLMLSGSEVWRIPKRLAVRVANDLAVLGCSVMNVSADGQRIDYRPISSLELTTAQRDVVARLVKTPETLAAGAIGLPPSAVLEHVLTQAAVTTADEWEPGRQQKVKFELPLPDGVRVTLVRTRPITRYVAGLTWSGEVEATGEKALLMLSNEGTLSGYFAFKGRIYAVDAANGGVQTMAEIDPVKLPAEHPPAHAERGDAVLVPSVGRRTEPAMPRIQPLLDETRRQLEAKEITLDLMLLYTKNAVNRYQAKPAIWSYMAVESINETFRNSGLGHISVRLVHHEVIDYEEGNAEQFDHLYRMVDGVGVFGGVRRLRDANRADIVGLVLHSPSGCGLSTRIGADADEAFFVVHHACAVITHSIPHEIGHILGARHDRAVDSTSTPFPYGHGHINGSKWRTMMSYQAGCDGCPRIPFWSNPRVLYRGEPTGTLATDNARVILENAERVSRFR